MALKIWLIGYFIQPSQIALIHLSFAHGGRILGLEMVTA